VLNTAEPAGATDLDNTVHGKPEPANPPSFGYPIAPEKPTFGPHSPSKDLRRGPEDEELAMGQVDADIPSQIADVATTRVDLVHDPSQASKDMSIRIELDAEEDWEDDLEEFCRLKRLGLVKEAKERFWSALAHVNTVPYIRVQYAEMLQSAGDFKSFHDLKFLPECPPSPSEETPDDRNRGKLVANYALLDLLSQRPLPRYLTAAWDVVRHTLKALASESTFGSTEVRRE
jgi:hypothetical protein